MNWNTVNNILLAILWLSVSLGQLTRISLPGGGAMYAHDLVIATWVGLIVIRSPKVILKIVEAFKNKAFRWELVLIGWVILGWVAAALAHTWEPVTLLYAGRLGLYCLWAWLMTQLVTFPFNLNFRAVTLTGLIMVAFGLCQYLLIPDTRFLAILGWDDHYYRLIGTLFDPNFTGMIFVLTFVYLERAKLLPKMHQTALLSFQIVTTIALGPTFSRASYLAWLVALLGILMIRGKRSLLVLICAPVLGLTILLAPKPSGEGVDLLRTASVTARVESTQETLTWNWRTLILGEGLFQPQRSATSSLGYDRPNTARFADTIIVGLFNWVGLGGLLLIFALALKWGRRLWRADRLLALALGVTLVHSLFNNTLFQPFVFLFLLGGFLLLAD